MKSYALAFAGLTAMTAPALAEEYYIVRHHDAKECVIVETKPEDVAIIIGDKAYASHEEAIADLAIVCAHVEDHHKPAHDYQDY